MRKLLQILAVPLVAFAFVAVGSTSVSAQQASGDCDDINISNTGAGSINEINCNGTYTIVIECQNNTQIVLDVTQDGTSGDATVSDNTTAGGVTTGDVVNISEVDALVENSNCFADEEPTKPVTPDKEEPEEEVQGAAVVRTLPDTGSANPLQAIALTAGAAIAILAAARVASNLYVRNRS